MRTVDYLTVKENPALAIGEEWALLTAGREGHYNTMTVSWGHIGSIWGDGKTGSSVCVYVRPQRYTKAFIDGNDYFTLSFYGEEARQKLAYLGTRSGRDEDKVSAVGMTPVFDEAAPYFAGARLVLVCKKQYHCDMTADGFDDPAVIETHYPEHDFHTMYIAQIVKTLVAE